MELISTIVTILLSGGISTLVTLRFVRLKAKVDVKKAETDVKTSELDNVQEAVKIWREMAESLRDELEKSRNNYTKVTEEIELLRKQINRLTCINSKILKLLDKLTPENLEKMVEQIKSEIHESNS
jgi:predicted  nucleic acid-binding Zn-ribbon protein